MAPNQVRRSKTGNPGMTPRVAFYVGICDTLRINRAYGSGHSWSGGGRHEKKLANNSRLDVGNSGLGAGRDGGGGEFHHHLGLSRRSLGPETSGGKGQNPFQRRPEAILQQQVGKTFFEEDTWENSPRRIENLFGCEFVYTEGATPWLHPAANEAQDFDRLLEQAEKTDLRTWALPEAFRQEWEMRQAAGKPLPILGGGSRGPATIMTSVLPVETAILWCLDQPERMERFCRLLAVKMIELNQVLRQFSGNSQPGWYILDDNCALFNRRLYAEYCFPVLEQVLDALAPGGADRYQHSDSAMGHLLDFQRQLGIKRVNYGPTVDIARIRQALPEAIIYGQMPPFLLRNGTPEAIRQRVADDFQRAGDPRKLAATTAGSLAAGTGVGRMRWYMQCVQDVCRW